ncbi:iron-containing alcohol dehydrogenase [Bacillus sp. 1P06AnD]|uniref:iron-containing alcohol dehydrogenase n=1 Tax=Bacillus sp. 1P06AnD TaxID=3132208 RepID=UPI0039A2FD09
MKEDFMFSLPTRIEFGTKKIHSLIEYVRELGGSRIMILTDKGIGNAGIVKKVTDILDHGRFRYLIFDSIKENPKDKDCMDAYRLAKKEKVDLLIGLGGGSSIDTAKAVGILLEHGGSLQDWYGINTLQKSITPLISIPTTSGTGSEITFFSVITDTNSKQKMNILDKKMAARIALLDPELTFTLPAPITASTGMDALTHAIEAYTCNLANPLTDAMALYAMELIVQNLPRAYRDGADEDARKQMMLGSLLAGIAFGNSDVAGVHCMAEALGGLYDTPHGVANSMILPYVFEYNIPSNIPKHAEVAKRLGVQPAGKTTEEIAYEGVDKLYWLAETVNIPEMADVDNIEPEDFAYLAEGATRNVSASSNPRPLSVNEYMSLFHAAYKGKKGRILWNK